MVGAAHLRIKHIDPGFPQSTARHSIMKTSVNYLVAALAFTSALTLADEEGGGSNSRQKRQIQTLLANALRQNPNLLGRLHFSTLWAEPIYAIGHTIHIPSTLLMQQIWWVEKGDGIFIRKQEGFLIMKTSFLGKSLV